MGAVGNENADCITVHEIDRVHRCNYVQNLSSCMDTDSYINYVKFIYCGFNERDTIIAIVLCCVFLVYLFLFMAINTDKFFCPLLEVISTSLKMSQNVAGVTLLALGNGAPDLFSAIASARQNKPVLVIGTLFGGGIYVTTVVAGIIYCMSNFKMAERPFLRDAIFYIIGVYATFCMFYTGTITMESAIFMIALYITYVVVVLVAHWVYENFLKSNEYLDKAVCERKNNNNQAPLRYNYSVNGLLTPNRSSFNDIEQSSGDMDCSQIQIVTEITGTERFIDNGTMRRMITHHSVTARDVDEIKTLVSEILTPGLLQALNPFAGWRFKSWYAKIFVIIKTPIVIISRLTVPLVDLTKPMNNWNKSLSCLHCVTVPLYYVIACDMYDFEIMPYVPMYLAVLPPGVIAALLLWRFTRSDAKPKYHTVVAFFGFVSAVTWIFLGANEVIGIVKAIGVVANLSDALLGLTVLAWGNSIGDLIANITVTRQGFPRMAISACFGGPLLNLLLGIGLPFSIVTFTQGGKVHIPISRDVILLTSFLLLSILSSLVIVPYAGFRVGKKYSIYLFAIYIVFIACSLLHEFEYF